MRWKPEPRVRKQTYWMPWFAWHPVKLENTGETVWLVLSYLGHWSQRIRTLAFLASFLVCHPVCAWAGERHQLILGNCIGHVETDGYGVRPTILFKNAREAINKSSLVESVRATRITNSASVDPEISNLFAVVSISAGIVFSISGVWLLTFGFRGHYGFLPNSVAVLLLLSVPLCIWWGMNMLPLRLSFAPTMPAHHASELDCLNILQLYGLASNRSIAGTFDFLRYRDDVHEGGRNCTYETAGT